jgi:hypothetical protein
MRDRDLLVVPVRDGTPPVEARSALFSSHSTILISQVLLATATIDASVRSQTSVNAFPLRS